MLNNKKILLRLLFFVFLILTGIYIYNLSQYKLKEDKVLKPDIKQDSKIKKIEQNRNELKIPEELISIMLDDAVLEYFNNFGDECYKIKGIIKPQFQYPVDFDIGKLNNEEIDELISKKYDLVYKTLRPILTIKDYEYSYKVVDFNNDNITEEFIIEPKSLCAPGKLSLRGATDNGSFLIYQKLNNNWKNIGIIIGNNYELLNTITENYQDLSTSWHMSASCYIERIYRWNKEKLFYDNDSSKEICSE